MSDTDLYIVLRTDLDLSLGKAIMQTVHAALRLGSHGWNYDTGVPIGVVKKVKSEEKLINIYNKLQEANVSVSIQVDAGLNEIPAGTPTALAIIPDMSGECERIIKRLRNL